MKYGDYTGPAEELIQRNLDEIERREGVRILLAVESGSRAWGFESPDSDYDVRFIYVRPVRDYLTLRPSRKDTIEWVVDETLDICGWDLSKALQLAHKGNLFFFEWGISPVVYRHADDWDKIWEVARGYFSCKAAMHSYLGIARTTDRDFLQGERVRYKKYLYAVRPLLACKFMAEQGLQPPVRFAELVAAAAPEDLKPAIAQLLDAKVHMCEKDEGERIAQIDAFIADGLVRYDRVAADMKPDGCGGWDELEQVFLDVVGVR